jgi:hypothetical protein
MDALYVSMTGGRASKLLCFVFDHGARSPAAVAKVIPDPRFAQGLRHEVSVLAEVRERALPDDVAAALPLAPLAADTVDGDFIAVEPVDELARHTGAENRDTALRWLERFHRATRTEATAWDAGDTERLLASARYAWEQTRPQRAGALLAELERRSAGLHGSAVDRCTSHGDFWRGNIASWGGSLRVFDWEWAEHGATPFLDLWAYELAPLLNRSWDGGSELVDALARASDNVRTAIAARGLPEDFAAVTLAPMLAELAFRFRRDRGIAGGSEARFARMLPAVERLMEAGSPRAS